MSMERKLFRPGKGQTLAAYTAAVSDGAMYPGDWVALSTTVPTSQGASGVMFGQTLTATDYLECTLLDTDNLGAHVLAMGVLMGKGIGAVSTWTDVTSAVVADQDVVVIQSFGIHPNASGADTGLLGDYIYPTTVAGEPLNGNLAALTAGLQPCGVLLANSATYKRITAADTEGGPTFVHCR